MTGTGQTDEPKPIEELAAGSECATTATSHHGEVDGQSFSVQLVKRNPWVRGLAALPLLGVPIFLLSALIMGDPRPLAALPHSVIFGVMASVFAYLRNPWPRFIEQRLRIDADALWIGTQRIDRSSLTGGYLVTQADRLLVRLTRGFGKSNIELRVRDEAEGSQILESLGLGAGQAVLSFRTMSRIHVSYRRLLGTILGGMLTAGALASMMFALNPIAGTVTALMSLIAVVGVSVAPSRLDVGADGLLIRWLGSERFIPHGEIVSVNSMLRGAGDNRHHVIELLLQSGETVVVPVANKQWDFGVTEGILGRIKRVFAQYRDGSLVHEAALLARGDRSHQEWVKALHVGGELSTHRSGVVIVERLWQMIEDVSRAPLERAAAAVALGTELAPKERARIQSAAAATAAPKLRIALECIAAEEEDEAIAEAMAELEAESAESAES